MQFLVHQLQLGPDAEDDFHTFLLGHLNICKADLPYVIDNIDAVQDDFTIDLVAVGGKGNGQGITRMGTQLVAESSEVADKMVYLVIEAIYLCGIHDDAVEAVKIVVELFLKVGCGIHLFRYPDMSR